MNSKTLIFLLSLLPVFGLMSCSETETTEEEYVDWQNRNETYFNGMYDKAVASTTDNLDTIRCYTLTTGVLAAKDDYIVVEKLSDGTGTGDSPLFTDSVDISYRGRLIPSTSYTDGYVFDQTYLGDFDWDTSNMTGMIVSGTVKGFATALQKMKKGDHWKVYIPYKLGYSSSSSSSVPAYSTLIFDIALHDFCHPDKDKFDPSTVYAKRRSSSGTSPIKQ